VQTMGSRLTLLEPYSGFSAELSAATSILYATQIGVPVSTTHTIAGAIAGVGAARRASSVRMRVSTASFLMRAQSSSNGPNRIMR